MKKTLTLLFALALLAAPLALVEARGGGRGGLNSRGSRSRTSRAEKDAAARAHDQNLDAARRDAAADAE